jgi:hypothetical protein
MAAGSDAASDVATSKSLEGEDLYERAKNLTYRPIIWSLI